ncbi:MAG: hypothetical protein D6681_18650 [Calditrichaeota bacterium]|nr:MAG: hypothetical protein D6681_18650 [Calditrichota bacterium]
MKRKGVCFVSDRNTCRSLIAEVYLRKLGREYFEVHSFGLEADRMHYLVREVLEERGLNPNYSFSKKYEVIKNQRFDIFVLMHPSLQEKLPRIPYEYRLEVWNFEPVALDQGDEQKVKETLHELCDQIEKRVKEFIENFKS